MLVMQWRWVQSQDPSEQTLVEERPCLPIVQSRLDRLGNFRVPTAVNESHRTRNKDLLNGPSALW